MPPADSTAHVLSPRGSAQANNCCVCREVARTLISANCCSSQPMATAVWDALWGSIPMMTVIGCSLRGRLGTARALLVWILCLVLFRATRGEVQTGSNSLESQSTGADGWHLESHSIWTSRRYELTGASAISLNQALEG